MKQTILSVALIAFAIGTSCNTQAQVTNLVTVDNKMSCTNAANHQGQTVIDGAWGIITDKAGNLVITDKDNAVVRMVAAEAGKPNGFENNAASYPFSLVVDKCGNLHITDKSIFPGTNQLPSVLPNESNTWGDPDMAAPLGIVGAQVATATR